MYPLYTRLIIQTEATGTETVVEFNGMSYRISSDEMEWLMVSVYLDGAATTDKIKISLPGVETLDYVYVNNEEITNLSSFCSSYDNSGWQTVYIEFTVGKVLSYPDNGNGEYRLHIVAGGTPPSGGDPGGGDPGGGDSGGGASGVACSQCGSTNTYCMQSMGPIERECTQCATHSKVIYEVWYCTNHQGDFDYMFCPVCGTRYY